MDLNKETKEIIIRNSRLLYNLLQRMYRYTFSELQRICKLSDTDLCLAIGRLLQEGKMKMDRGEQGVYYMCIA
ncbi:MAG: winged helix-turn-helix domain-containing protein [Bacteroides sp.]|nr:winged helix-turn-helix domain-containing protein [Bacteroides sp.]